METLRVTPVNAQVRYRGTFFPANYNLLVPQIAAELAGKLSEVFGLKSANIVVNQNALSTHYFSFRHILPNAPVRYLDASIGVDQAEVVFSNTATALELKEECLKLWEVIIDKAKPTIIDHYFEASFHSTTEGIGAAKFLNKFVNVKPTVKDIQRGFSITAKKPQIEGEARIALEVSGSIPDGLYVVFGCVSRKRIDGITALGALFDMAIQSYRDIQTLAQIAIVEAP